MIGRLRDRVTFSNVVALLALFVALGGSAYAIKKIRTKQIANGAVTAKKLRNGAVTDKKVPDLNFQALDFGNGWEAVPTLGAGPAGVAKDVQGIVHLRGVIRQDSGLGGTAFVLPAGLRPGSATAIPVSCLTLGVTAASLIIEVGGGVTVIATGGDPQSTCEDAGLGTSLDGVTFDAGA